MQARLGARNWLSSHFLLGLGLSLELVATNEEEGKRCEQVTFCMFVSGWVDDRTVIKTRNSETTYYQI